MESLFRHMLVKNCRNDKMNDLNRHRGLFPDAVEIIIFHKWHFSKPTLNRQTETVRNGHIGAFAFDRKILVFNLCGPEQGF